MFLVGHGYAPVVTVRDGNGDVAYSGPVVFLPQDSPFASFGVVKVPDARPKQLGFEGLFLPTYGFTMRGGPFSHVPRRRSTRRSRCWPTTATSGSTAASRSRSTSSTSPSMKLLQEARRHDSVRVNLFNRARR